MDLKVQMMLEKAKVLADKTGKAAVRAADTAGKKASEMAHATRLNLQIFDLNTECEVIFKEIGKLVYDIHCGAETQENALEEKLVQLDEKREQVAELKSQLAGAKTSYLCPNCGRNCTKEAAFCPSCGAQL